MDNTIVFSNYYITGDVSAFTMCILNLILLHSSYSFKEKGLFMFRSANIASMFASISSIIFHFLVNHIEACNVWIVYLTGYIMYIGLILCFAIFCTYLQNIVKLSSAFRKGILVLVWASFFSFVIVLLLSSVTHFGFYVDQNLRFHQNYYCDPFTFWYLIFAVISAGFLIFLKRKLITKVRRCLLEVMVLSFVIMGIQTMFKQTAYTCITFAFPIISALFLFHYNAYDIETGTLDDKAYHSYIKGMKNKKFSMICLYLEDINTEKNVSLSEHLYHFNERFFVEHCIFRIHDDKLILVYPDAQNPNGKEQFPMLLQDFERLYEFYHLDYKIVFIHSNEKLQNGLSYIGLDQFIEQHLEINTYHYCTEEDIDSFLKHQYICNELKDINACKNLEDERVELFCQPVLNLTNNRFDSAEALTRLYLKDCGRVFPDQFIRIIEQEGYMYNYSKIVLAKTCKLIKEMIEAGQEVKRISVNFSISEFRNPNFCDDVIRIIKDYNISPEKIAIEITESWEERDYENIKKVVFSLRKLGLRFYLDDFGTGYSNFERILGLPIDIIKFDRSLTILSGKDDKSYNLVSGLANIFANNQYKVLFEGIENEADEKRCVLMHASYLQGFKYSKPIPVEEYKKMLQK